MGAPVIALAGQIPVIRDRPGARPPARDPRPDRIAAPHRQTRRTHPFAARGVRARRPVDRRCSFGSRRGRWHWNARSTFGARRRRSRSRPPIAVAPPCADPSTVAAAADLLVKARRPLIVVGGGALGAGPEVQAICGNAAGPGFVVPAGQGGDPDLASAGGVVHRRARVVEDRRRGAGDRHAAVLATGELGGG